MPAPDSDTPTDPGPIDAIAVLRAIVDLPAELRTARLDELCGANRELRREVEDLLRHLDAPDTVLRDFATRERTPATSPVSAPTVVSARPARRVRWPHAVAGLGALGLGASLWHYGGRAHERRTYELRLGEARAVVTSDPLVCRALLSAAPTALRDARWTALQVAIDPVVATLAGPPGVPVSECDVAFTAAGAPRLAYARGAIVHVIDVATGATVVQLHTTAVVQLPSFSVDAGTVAAWTDTDSAAPAIVVWDVASGAVLGTCRIPAAHAVRLTFDAAAKRLAWHDRAVANVLEVATCAVRVFGAEPRATLLHFAADGDALWLGAHCHALGEAHPRAATRALAEWVVPSRNGAWLAVGDGHRVWLEPTAPDTLRPLTASLSAAPHAAASSADDRYLALAVGEAVTVCDLTAGHVRTIAHATHRVALDRAGRHLLVLDGSGAALLRF